MIKKYKEIIILIVSLAGIFQIYLYTTFPTFKNDDSPETITSAYTLGISHPPGYPLFTMAAKIFSLLPVGSPAFRINLFAIFLGLMALLLFYFIIKKNIYFIFNDNNKIINCFGVFVMAFSFLFWNQTIEAKGGIYILNLLFLSALIYLSFNLFYTFNTGRFYLLIYIFGLSLTNHWPSMLIFFPALGYIFYKYREKLAVKNLIISLILLLLGLSVYAFLPLRIQNENIFVFIDRPDNIGDFLRLIFLSGYEHKTLPNLDINNYQIEEIITLLLKDFYVFWIFIILGIYELWRRKKEILFFYLSMLLTNLFIVVFSLRLGEIYKWATGTFLMPSIYILFIFLINGMHLLSKNAKAIFLKNTFYSLSIVILLCAGFLNFSINNSSVNYLSYDFENNVAATMEPGSFYIPYGDNYALPASYRQIVQHKADNINILTIYNLSHEWGINSIVKKYGQITLKQGYLNVMDNIGNITGKYFPEKNIYFSQGFPGKMKNHIGNFKLKSKGLLLRVAAENEHIPAGIFKNYAFRGIFAAKDDYDKALISLYSAQLTNQAYDFFDEKRYKEAIETYKYALLFPWNSAKAYTYYDLFLAYKAISDEDNQIKYLKETFRAKENYYKAYEVLGGIYFNERLWPMAKEMFEKAIQYGSDNKAMLQQYVNQIDEINTYSQFKALSGQAAAFMASGRYLKALDLFGFLLEQNYAAVEVYKNMGICNFKINNFEEALKYFQKASESDKSAVNYTDIAQTYIKLGQPYKALNTLREAMQVFGNDPQLVNLYNQIQHAEKVKK